MTIAVRNSRRIRLSLLTAAAMGLALYFGLGLLAYENKSLRLVEQGPAYGSVADAPLETLLQHARESHSDAIVIFREGALVGEWNASSTVSAIEAMSVTKSVVSLAAARAMTLGNIGSFDEKVHKFFPEWDSDLHGSITLRHLLAHVSGLECLPDTSKIYQQSDFVQFALDAVPLSAPGTVFQYNNRQTNLIPAIIEKSTGQNFEEFVRLELFGKLGIQAFTWARDSRGNAQGMAGLGIAPKDLAKLGLLIINRGKWNGKQLIDEALIDEMLTPGHELTPNHGLLWWLRFESGQLASVNADGYLGQYLVILPSSGIVAVRMYEVGYNHWFTFDTESDDYDGFLADVMQLDR